MPKGKGKKKGKGKGKGDKKAAGGPPPPEKVAEEPLDELSKQFYLIQIRDLEERLGRYQAKCDKLRLENQELQEQLRQQVEDQEQMIAFLKRKNQEQAEQYVDLEEKVMALQQAKESEKERLEQQITQMKEDSQRALDQAAIENKLLQGKLESLETFRENKEKLEAELRQKEELIEKLKGEFDEKLYNLEKKAVLDKDRMKKEMVSKVNAVAGEFRKVSDLQMAETTKRAIRENVAINQQLGRMSDKTMELLRENEALKVREKDLRRQLEVLEYNEKELAKKNINSQKVLAMLKDYAGDQGEQLAILYQKAQQCDQLEEEVQQAHQHATRCSKEVEHHKHLVSTLEGELAGVRVQLADSTEELQRLKTVLTRASHTIQASLLPVSSESQQKAQRDSLLATLLDLLNLTPSTPPSQEDPTSFSSPHHHHHPAPSHTPLPKIQYKPGDLGLVPVASTTGTKGHTHSQRSHLLTQQCSGGAGTQLPPLPVSSLTVNKVR